MEDKLYIITVGGEADDLEAVENAIRLILVKDNRGVSMGMKRRLLKIGRLINAQLIEQNLNHWEPSIYDDIKIILDRRDAEGDD